MMSLSILWTLLFLATVKARSDLSITDAALSNENTRSEENALRSDTNNQHSADIEEAILSRIGFDALTHPIVSKLSNSDGVKLENALDEKLQDISDTLSRLSGMEPNEVPDTNYDILSMSKSDVANSDAVYNRQDNLRNDVYRILDGGVNDVSVLSGPNRDGLLNVLNSNRHNVNPVSAIHSRSYQWPNFNVRDGGYNKLNVKERDAIIYADPNVERDSLLTRMATLNGAQDSKLNNLLVTKTYGPNAVQQRNNVLDTSKYGSRFIGRQGLSDNDVENVKTDSDKDVAAIDEINASRRSLVDTEKVNRNSKHLNTRRNNILNTLESNDLANTLVNVRSASKGYHDLNKISSSADDSNVIDVLDHLNRHGVPTNRHGIRKSNLNDLNQVKYALSNLESNAFHKTGSIDVDHDLANIIANVRASGNELNELNDVSNDANVFEHLSKHGLHNNRNGLTKVSLNDLNNAKRLLGPLSFDKVTANRVGNEIDGALLNALNAQDDFNALGALAVLNKAAAQASENLLLNSIIGRNDNDVESNLLSKIAATEDSDVNGLVSSNPLQEVINDLVVLSKIDSASDIESVHSAYSPEILSRSHTNLLHNLVDSTGKFEDQISEAEVDDVDSLLRIGANRWNNRKLKRYGVPIRPTRLYPHNRYRPYRHHNVPVPMYRPRVGSGLYQDESQVNLAELSKLAKLNNVASVRNLHLDDLVSALDKGGVSDVSADLSAEQLDNLVAFHDQGVHGRNHLGHLSDVIDKISVRQSVSQLDKDLRDAKSLLLAGSLSNLNDQRQRVSDKSNLRLYSRQENNKLDDVVLVPVRVGSGSVVGRSGGPYDVSDVVNFDDVN